MLFKDDQTDFQELQELAPVLQKIEGMTNMTSIRKTANDLRVSILTHGAVVSHASGEAEDVKGKILYFIVCMFTEQE